MKSVYANYFEIKGSNYEIGFRLGKMISGNPSLIGRLVAETRVISPEGENKIIMMFDRYCQGLNEEIQGFSDALNIEKSKIIFYRLTYLAPACSQIVILPGLSKNNHTLLARNYDYRETMDDFCLCKTTVSGKYAHIGTNVMQFGRGEGINECGLAVSQSSCGKPVNNYMGGKKPQIMGLQFWVVVRTLLENCSNVEEAIQFIDTMPIACNINLILADKSGKAALVEIIDGEKGVDLIHEKSDKKCLMATNHAHIDTMKKLDPYAIKNSIIRYECMEKWIASNRQVNEDNLKELLLTPYPNGLMLKYYDDFFGTIKSLIFNLDLGRVNICWGGLNENNWQSFSFSEKFSPMSLEQQIKKDNTPPDFFALQTIWNDSGIILESGREMDMDTITKVEEQ
ncbi:MAG: linear amide C-N hydrolase [Clostridiales bacterium]|nr:linear amide C-N hydrolase [Clostridiales bacterium]